MTLALNRIVECPGKLWVWHVSPCSPGSEGAFILYEVLIFIGIVIGNGAKDPSQLSDYG